MAHSMFCCYDVYEVNRQIRNFVSSLLIAPSMLDRHQSHESPDGSDSDDDGEDEVHHINSVGEKLHVGNKHGDIPSEIFRPTPRRTLPN